MATAKKPASGAAKALSSKGTSKAEKSEASAKMTAAKDAKSSKKK